MYAKIRISKNIKNVLYYHEEKISKGQAHCLYAGNFIKDLNDLTWSDKVYHFQRLSSLNDGVRRPIVHISLNFHPIGFAIRPKNAGDFPRVHAKMEILRSTLACLHPFR